jgi:hypothetical protein
MIRTAKKGMGSMILAERQRVDPVQLCRPNCTLNGRMGADQSGDAPSARDFPAPLYDRFAPAPGRTANPAKVVSKEWRGFGDQSIDMPFDVPVMVEVLRRALPSRFSKLTSTERPSAVAVRYEGFQDEFIFAWQ